MSAAARRPAAHHGRRRHPSRGHQARPGGRRAAGGRPRRALRRHRPAQRPAALRRPVRRAGLHARRGLDAGRRRGPAGRSAADPRVRRPRGPPPRHRPGARRHLHRAAGGARRPSRRRRGGPPRGRAALLQRAVDGGEQPAHGGRARRAAPRADRHGREFLLPRRRRRRAGSGSWATRCSTRSGRPAWSGCRWPSGAACCSPRTAPPTSTTRCGWPSWSRWCEGLAQRPGGVLFPVHPRTRDRLVAAGLLGRARRLPGADLVDPLPYVAMLRALAGCRVAVTDSGGLQEEASYLGVPVVVMRSTTPRWEGVRTGAATLCGLDRDRVLTAVDRLRRRRAGPHRRAALPLRRRPDRRAGRRGARRPRRPGAARAARPRAGGRRPGGPRHDRAHRPGRDGRPRRHAVRPAAWLDGAWTAVGERSGQLGLDGAALTTLLRSVAAEGSDRGGIIDRALVALGVHPAPYVGRAGRGLPRARPGAAPALSRRARGAGPRCGATVPGRGDHRRRPADPARQDRRAGRGPAGRLRGGLRRAGRAGSCASRTRRPSGGPWSCWASPPEHVVHVGDRPAKDVAGAASVGMRSVRVRTGEYAGLADPGGLRPGARPPPSPRRSRSSGRTFCPSGNSRGVLAVMTSGPVSGRLVRWFRFTSRAAGRPGDR